MIKVSIDRITPNPLNPRKKFDQAALEELAASIREVGILQPLVVVEEDPYAQEPSFRIIAGERRWRAAKLAGLAEVPVTVTDITPAQEAQIMLIENLQREDLDPIDEARAFASLTQEHGWKQTELAEKLGCSQAHIANRIRLLKLPAQLQENISAGIIPHSVGKELVTFAAIPEVMRKIAKTVDDAKKENKPVSTLVVSVAKRDAWEGSMPLHKGEYPQPEFDTNPCDRCEKRVLLLKPYSDEDSNHRHPRCLDEDCWNMKQAAAQKEKAEKALQKAQKAAGDSDLLDISALSWNDYHYLDFSEESHVFRPAGCDGCEKMKVTVRKNYKDEISDPRMTCLDPTCFEAKKKAAEREEKKLEKLRRAAFDSYKDDKFSEATLPRDVWVYVAAQMIEHCPYSVGVMDRRGLLKAVCARYGWDASKLEGARYEDRIKDMVANISALPDDEIRRLIFFVALKPVGQDNTVFKAVFGDVLAEKRENEAAS